MIPTNWLQSFTYLQAAMPQDHDKDGCDTLISHQPTIVLQHRSLFPRRRPNAEQYVLRRENGGGREESRIDDVEDEDGYFLKSLLRYITHRPH